MKRKILEVMMAVCVFVIFGTYTAKAEGMYGDYLYYEKYYATGNFVDEDLEIVITGCKGNRTEIEIPDEIDGLPVTRIDGYAFYNYSDLTKIIIPPRVNYIGNAAFSGCPNLTSISLPDSPIYIGRGAFDYEVCEDGYIGSHLIYKYANTICLIKEGTKSIADGAFDNYSAFTKMTHLFIPDSVKCIADRAFEQCNVLTDVYYQGTEEEWYNINVGDSNFALYRADFHYECNDFNKVIINEGKCGDSAVWTLNAEGTLTISGEGEIKGYSFSEYNFDNYEYIKNVVIESGITNTGNCAYDGCKMLESITLSDTVTTIDFMTEGSHKKDLSSFKAINVDDNNPKYSSADGVLFNKDKSRLITYPQGKQDESYTVASTVTCIGVGAFENCSKLTNILLPESITEIEFAAFEKCVSLKEISIPYGVTRLDCVFRGCTSLTNVAIPDTVTDMWKYNFDDCASLVEINIPKSVESFGVSSGCSSLKAINVDAENEKYHSENGVLFDKEKTVLLRCPEALECDRYIIPDTVTNIAADAFEDCSKIKNIEMPDSVTEIGSAAFWGCNVESVKMSENVAIIDTMTFDDCQALTEITLPQNLSEIGGAAFKNCKSLKSVYIPSSVISIQDDAFNGCSSLEKIEVDKNNESYTSIDGVLFNKDCSKLIQYSCGSLNTVYKIPDSVINIGHGTFANSQHLTDVILSRNMEIISEYTFNECPLLTNVTLPRGIKEIAAASFFDCKSLKNIYYEGTETEWRSVSFSYRYDNMGRDLYIVRAEKHFNADLPLAEKCFMIETAQNQASVKNTSSIPQRAGIIIATYENSKLINLSSEQTLFNSGETKTYEFDDSKEMKIFVWYSIKSMYPLNMRKLFMVICKTNKKNSNSRYLYKTVYSGTIERLKTA